MKKLFHCHRIQQIKNNTLITRALPEKYFNNTTNWCGNFSSMCRKKPEYFYNPNTVFSG